MGVYRLWRRLFGGATVDWILLPATLLGELAYAAGRVVTGRPSYAGLISPQNPAEDPCGHAIAGKFALPVAMLSSTLTIGLCGGALLASAKLCGKEVLNGFALCDGLHSLSRLPRELPDGWGSLWDLAALQIDMIRRVLEGWASVDWTDWPVPLFVYLSAAFTVRLGPVRHDQRAMVLVALALSGLIALGGAVFPAVDDLVRGDLWYLLSYCWAVLLVLLAGTMLIRGVIALVSLLLPGRVKPATSRPQTA
jgi:hypothetical protein